MSARLQVHDTRGGPAFELDRFGLVDGERYEVEGRWSGVRGRLFIRPELTLTNGKQSQRLLADLAQKPWQTADGETWAVAFPCADGPIAATEVELTVAPDITVTVKRGRASRTRSGHVGAARKPASVKDSAPVPVRADTVPKPTGRRRGLGVQLAEAQSELEQVREQTTRLVDRLNAAMRRAEEARAEREHIAAARDALLVERNQAAAERETANRLAAVDREAAQRTEDELEQARKELAQALTTLDQTTAERDSAIRAGVEVERELQAAKTAREDLLKEREQLVARQSWLKEELKRLAATHAEDRDEPEQPRAARRNLAVPRQAPLPASNRDDDWIFGDRRFSTGSPKHSRVAALVALTVAIVAVVLVLLLLVF
ncbi:MAG: hypothetical protein KGL15_02805 [Acidobacteriota bacterium]|nr:hypothetical protein [Acidobacteriota bacterium]